MQWEACFWWLGLWPGCLYRSVQECDHDCSCLPTARRPTTPAKTRADFTFRIVRLVQNLKIATAFERQRPSGWCDPVHRCSASRAHAALRHHPRRNSGHEEERTVVAISASHNRSSSAAHIKPQKEKNGTMRSLFTPNWCMSWIRESPTNRTSGSLSLLSDTKRWCYK